MNIETSKGGLTKITDTATGEEVHGVTHASIDIVPRQPAKARLQLFAERIAVQARPEFYVKDPWTGEIKTVRRIEFTDGKVLDFDAD